ncbi:MAG: carbonic anhydrase [Candidatus Latescibacterota bacterium]
MVKEASYSPDEALRLLQEGHARFVAGKPKYPHSCVDRCREVAEGQKPFAIVLTCSDSRVPPEIIFDRGIGDLFIIRVAGNVAEPAVMGSLLLAVGHFGCPIVVVMGHESCGAIKASLSADSVLIREPVGVIKLVELIRENIPESLGDPERNERVIHDAVMENLFATVRSIGEDSFVADRVAAGTLRIVPALYSLETGKIAWV